MHTTQENNDMSFKVFITRDFDQMSEQAAAFTIRHMNRLLADKGRYTLGLATGSSPTGLYKHLAKAVNAGTLAASNVRSFNLDEYVGLPGENAQARALHPESYSYFMIQELFGLLQTKFSETNVPWGCLLDQQKLMDELNAYPNDWEAQGADKGKAIVIKPDAESDYLRWVRSAILDAYAAKIKQAGGIDLHIIGVGGRGHVAFHEAGIPFEGNEMLLVKLDENTVDNAVADGHFAAKEDSPQYAISMGAELVYQAGTVVLLASGPRKAEPVAASLIDAPSPAVPISYGQLFSERGGDMVYFIDQAAATDVLARRTEIEAKGIEIIDLTGEAPGKRVEDLVFFRHDDTGLMG